MTEIHVNAERKTVRYQGGRGAHARAGGDVRWSSELYINIDKGR